MNILLVDDHPAFRKGLRLLLEDEGDLKVVGEAGDGQSAVKLSHELQPDVIVMDISMPGMNGIEATRSIMQESPDSKILAFSMHSGRQFVEGMLQAGVTGYILKESAPEDLVDGVRAVSRGEIYLSSEVNEVIVTGYKSMLQQTTPIEPQESPHSQARHSILIEDLTNREYDTLKLLTDRLYDKEIAEKLSVSTETVRTHLKHIYQKLQVNNRRQAIAKSKELGLISN